MIPLIPLLALLVSAAALAVLTLTTAQRPGRIPDFDGYLKRWSPLHGGYDPRGTVWVLAWLRVTYAVGRPLARRGILPDLVTAWGLWLALAVLVAAWAGGGWLLCAGGLVVLGGTVDALDGCVALLSGRASGWGYVLDSMVDRVTDVIYLGALVVAGGAPAPAMLAGLALFLLEYLRARAGNVGVEEIAVVTVGERPTRVILCTTGFLAAGLFGAQAAVLTTIALAAVAAVSLIGTGQLGVAVHRRLVRQPG